MKPYFQNKTIKTVIILIIMFVFIFGLNVHAELEVGAITGKVLSTDIVANINNKPIPSYNYNGYTVIIVKDLKSYGFEVNWNPIERKVEVIRNTDKEITGKEINTSAHLEPGTKLFNVLHTDIITYIDNQRVDSFNIDGHTVIYFNALSDHGKLEWNQNARMASLYLKDPVNAESNDKELDQNENKHASRQATSTPVTRQKTTIDPDERFLHQGDYHPSMIPDDVKIGLYFGDAAVSSIELESGGGFQAGVLESGNFSHIMSLEGKNRLTLSKDTNYYVAPQTNFQNLSQVNSEINKLTDLTEYSLIYAGLDNGWNIYAGPFESLQQAEKASDELSVANSEKWSVIRPNQEHILVSLSNTPIMTYHTEQPLYFAAAGVDYEESIISIGSKKFRGAATAFRQKNSDLTIVNLVPTEKYLYGVVPREMPHSWPEEALKAQAVAARGFAVASMNKYSDYGFNLCSTVNSQVYGGYDAEQSRTNQAVDLTRGQVITYNGHLAIPYYHSSSGGHTEDSENIWTNTVPYIRGVKDEYSLNSPHSQWERELKKTEIETILFDNNIRVGELKNLYIAEVSSNGRVLSFIVEGSYGTEELIKQESRSLFGLRSSWFNVEYEADTKTYYFIGQGFGHGIGMSQYGAKGMAEEGYRYTDILKHYFTGVRIH